FLRGVRDWRTGECPRQGSLRPLEPSQDRGGLQGVRARASSGMRERQAARATAAQHQGSLVIALIDYKAGNLTSVKKALTTIGADVFVPERPDALVEARAIIVPGVGHFGATRALDAAWIEGILERIGEGRPLLGICLGMQWLFEGSDEAPDLPGLWLLSGQCYKLPSTHVKIPHVGWNSLDVRRESAIADDVASHAQVYFTHSFVEPCTGDTVA